MFKALNTTLILAALTASINVYSGNDFDPKEVVSRSRSEIIEALKIEFNEHLSRGQDSFYHQIKESTAPEIASVNKEAKTILVTGEVSYLKGSDRSPAPYQIELYETELGWRARTPTMWSKNDVLDQSTLETLIRKMESRIKAYAKNTVIPRNARSDRKNWMMQEHSFKISIAENTKDFVNIEIEFKISPEGNEFTKYSPIGARLQLVRNRNTWKIQEMPPRAYINDYYTAEMASNILESNRNKIEDLIRWEKERFNFGFKEDTKPMRLNIEFDKLDLEFVSTRPGIIEIKAIVPLRADSSRVGQYDYKLGIYKGELIRYPINLTLVQIDNNQWDVKSRQAKWSQLSQGLKCSKVAGN